jgi:phage terminase large subunit-like protein
VLSTSTSRSTPSPIADVGVLLRERRRRRKANPLRYRRLWHREAPCTSQRAAVQAILVPGVLIGLLIGGNRSGKTEAGAQVGTAYALGRDDPSARAWCEANGIDPEALPRAPSRVWAIALDSNDSRRYLRPKYAALLPAGTKWRNQDGSGEAEARLPNGSVIVFKSVDQGADGFQGDAIDLAHFDEEPSDKAVVNETMMRLVDRNGRLIVTMTPLRGLTWLYDRWVKTADADAVVRWLHGEDNPHVPTEVLLRILSKFGAHEQAARRRGEFVALEGRVYQFSRHLHFVPSFAIPADWPRFRVWDFGTSNPTCVLWFALDTKDDVLHVYREHYQAGWTLKQHADHVKALEVGEFYWTVADPEDAGSRLSLAVEHGIENIAAVKDIRPGINRVAERLAPDVEGRPHLVVHDCCTATMQEFEGYVWAKRSGPTNDPDLPLKANDHAMDCIRYQCTALSRSEFARVADDPEPEEAAA